MPLQGFFRHLAIHRCGLKDEADFLKGELYLRIRKFWPR